MRDNDKCWCKSEKEYKCCTEVAHQEKRTNAADRENNVFCNTFCALQLVQRSRTDENERELDELRRLDGETSELQPSVSTVDRFEKEAEYKSQKRQQHPDNAQFCHSSVSLIIKM